MWIKVIFTATNIALNLKKSCNWLCQGIEDICLVEYENEYEYEYEYANQVTDVKC